MGTRKKDRIPFNYSSDYFSRKRWRAYELAKEAGMRMENAAELMRSIGITVNSHMSSIYLEDANRFRTIIENARQTQPEFKLALELRNGKFHLIWITDSGIVFDGPPAHLQLSLVVNCFFVGRLLKQEKSIHEFEDLLSNPNTNENDIRKFLIEHQEVFDLLGYEDPHTEVCLPGILSDEERRIDFLLKPQGEEFYDILELKRHDVNTYIDIRGIPGLAAKVYRALEQARRYREIIERNSSIRMSLERRLGIRLHMPRCIIFVGKSGKWISPEQKRAIHFPIEPDKIFSYDDVIRKLKLSFDAKYGRS
jgi:hypothetical protein